MPLSDRDRETYLAEYEGRPDLRWGRRLAVMLLALFAAALLVVLL